MVAAAAAAVDPDPLAGGPGEPRNHLGRDGLLRRRLQHRGGPRGAGCRLAGGKGRGHHGALSVRINREPGAPVLLSGRENDGVLLARRTVRA